jgi:glycosyltransferase involved in cell wall biosynthesis
MVKLLNLTMQAKKNKTRIVFSVINCACHDQRIRKIAGIVSGMDCDITIVGRKRGGCCASGLVPFSTISFNMLFRRGFLFYMFFNIRLFTYLLFHKYDILVSNDLDTLLPNFLVSKIRSIPLIYDSHEYFTGMPEIRDRPFVKFVWNLIESSIFPHLKHVMTVSDHISEKYWDQYGIRPVVVRNCAYSSGHIMPYSRDELKIENEMMLVILQGTGINIDRGGEELIDALTLLGNVFLLIIGSGDSIHNLKNRVNLAGKSGNVRFINSMPWEELMRYTKSADIGVSLDKDTNLNYRFSLPNKLFDYISAGIGVLASDLPELRRIINEYRCGIIIDEVTPEKIAAALSNLSHNRERLNEFKKNASTAAAKLNWDIESIKIKELYLNVLGHKT